MNRRVSGFTLIEMIVAIMILLLFMGAVFGTYSATNRAMTMAQDQTEIFQTGRVLLEQLHKELSCAYQSSTATVSQLDGEYTNGTAMNLTFLTTAHPAPAGQPGGDLCQVTYQIGNETTTVIGATTPTVPTGDPAAQSTGLYVLEDYYPGLEMSMTTLTPRLLSSLVTGMTCQYLDSNGNWTNTWSNTDQTTLPVAVYVALTLQPRTPGAQPIILSTTANLMMATAAPATVTTAGGSNASP